MLAKKTSKNQITIPKRIVDQLPDVSYFNVEFEEGIILLKPLKFYETDLQKIRLKVKSLGIDDKSVAEAVKWARSK
jgi:hypothetical protein